MSEGLAGSILWGGSGGGGFPVSEGLAGSIAWGGWEGRGSKPSSES